MKTLQRSKRMTLVELSNWSYRTRTLSLMNSSINFLLCGSNGPIRRLVEGLCGFGMKWIQNVSSSVTELLVFLTGDGFHLF